MGDDRAVQAAEAHRLAGEIERLAKQRADQHREHRDRLMRELREDDPQRWTYTALAGAVGCSPELAAAIVKGRTVKGRTAARP